MDFKYSLVYIAVNTFCFIVASIIVSKFSLNIGSETDIIIFRKMVISYGIFLICEIFWALGISSIIPIHPTIYGLIKIFGTFFIPLMVFYWFRFALNRFHIEIKNKTIKYLAYIPITLLLILYLSSYFTGLIYKIDQNGNVINGPAYFAGGLVNNIYGILIVINALVLLLNKKDKTDNSAYINQIIFMVICTIGGILDARVIDAPIMQLAICLSFINLFIQIQEPHIYNDSLTKLNNRRSTEIYIKNIIDNDKQNWHLFMIDVDEFKNINDTKGHIFGDTILRLIAESLSEVADKYDKSFVARWGGDEFVMLIQNKKDDFTTELSDKLHTEINKNLKKNNIDSNVHLSLGHTKFNKNKIHNIQEFIEIADKELYISKKNNK